MVRYSGHQESKRKHVENMTTGVAGTKSNKEKGKIEHQHDGKKMGEKKFA